MYPYVYFSQSARKGYINHFPSAVRYESTGEEVGVEIAFAIFELQRHLLRMDHNYHIQTYTNLQVGAGVPSSKRDEGDGKDISTHYSFPVLRMALSTIDPASQKRSPLPW